MSAAGKVIRGRFEAGRPTPYHKNPPYSQSPDAELGVAGRTLRDWARHLSDNSSIVAAIISARLTNGIGPGLTYEPLVKSRKGELIPEINDRLRRFHARWSESADVSGELTRQEVERLVWRGWDVDGEAFVRRVVNSDGYRVELIPSEWIPFELTSDRGNRRIVHGIDKDQWGRPRTYFVHPDQWDVYGDQAYTNLEKMIQIAAADVWHLKRVQRPRQTRGVTLLHAIIFRVADIAEYQMSHRLAARASADLFASINRSAELLDETATDTEADDDNEQPQHETTQFDRLTILDYLAPGESVNFHSPSHPNQNAVEFVNQELRAIASATETGFSQIAQVFDSSYAAQRLEIVDTYRKTVAAREKFINDFAKAALYRAPISQAILERRIPQSLLRRADPETLYDVRIDGPRMAIIDPVKDRKAFEMDQKNNWDSRPAIIRRLGRVPGDVDAEIEQDQLTGADDDIPDSSESEQ